MSAWVTSAANNAQAGRRGPQQSEDTYAQGRGQPNCWHVLIIG